MSKRKSPVLYSHFKSLNRLCNKCKTNKQTHSQFCNFWADMFQHKTLTDYMEYECNVLCWTSLKTNQKVLTKFVAFT